MHFIGALLEKKMSEKKLPDLETKFQHKKQQPPVPMQPVYKGPPRPIGMQPQQRLPVQKQRIPPPRPTQPKPSHGTIPLAPPLPQQIPQAPALHPRLLAKTGRIPQLEREIQASALKLDALHRAVLDAFGGPNLNQAVQNYESEAKKADADMREYDKLTQE